jgi:hypothetical protein
MQLIVNIQNENIADKIIWFLKSFQDKGIEILNHETKDSDLINEEDERLVKKEWRDIVMNTHSANIEDDEYLYDAAWEFYSEKYSD